MRSLGKIFLYAVAVLLVGALAAPQAWHLLQILPPNWLGGLIGDVQQMPFHRYFSRSLQVTGVVLLWPLLRSLHVRSFEELGLYRSTSRLRDLSAGLAAGLVAALLLQPLLLFTGAFALNGSCSPGVVPKILMTATVVAILEEFLFRGVLLGFCRQFMSPFFAILFSSVAFAAVHFVKFSGSASETTPPVWWSGLAQLGHAGGSLPPWTFLAWSFCTLLVAGMILGWMTVRTGSLVAAMGLHGSWIFGQQLFNSATGWHLRAPGELMPLVGPPQCFGMVPVGLLPLVCLSLAGWVAALLLKRRPSPPIFPVVRGA